MKFKEYLQEKKEEYNLEVSVKGAKKANDIVDDKFRNELKKKIITKDSTNSYIINASDIYIDLYDTLKNAKIEILDYTEHDDID
jgi:hypothetical protein